MCTLHVKCKINPQKTERNLGERCRQDTNHKVSASCPGWPFRGSSEHSSQTKINTSSPLITEALSGSWLGPYMRVDSSQQHSMYGTAVCLVPHKLQFSAVSSLLPATQAERRYASWVWVDIRSLDKPRETVWVPYCTLVLALHDTCAIAAASLEPPSKLPSQYNKLGRAPIRAIFQLATYGDKLINPHDR